MLISKFPAAFAATFLAAPFALAQSETPLRAQSALSLDGTIYNASTPPRFDACPQPRLPSVLIPNF